MSWLWRFLGRFPRTISGLIVAAFAAGLWAAADYVETVIEPREAAARQARIAAGISRADALFARDKFEVAITEYGYALDSFAAELAPQEAARIHDRTGLARIRLAERHGGFGETAGAAEDLEQAIGAFARALDIRAAAGDAAAQVETLHRIGDAHRALAHARRDAAPLDRAAAAYRAALEIVDNGETGGDPVRRASALRALATAHRDRFEIGGDPAALATAFSLYDEALAAADPETWPEPRGETLIEIGLAYVQEANNGYRTRNLLKAVETLEGARPFLRIEDSPRAHALLHKHIGDTYVLLSRTEPRRRSDRASHQQFVVRWQNRAERAYKIARSFGYRPAQANIVPGNPNAVPDTAEEEDKTE